MKRLFRKWLKRQIIKAQSDLKQDAFEWIYNSPLFTWKDKLNCIKYDRNFYRETYDWLIEGEHHKG